MDRSCTVQATALDVGQCDCSGVVMRTSCSHGTREPFADALGQTTKLSRALEFAGLVVDCCRYLTKEFLAVEREPERR